MEKCKENGMAFLIILETSNFLWFELPAIKTSRAFFQLYLIKEMTFEEGKQELVMQNKMFILNDYRYI